MKAYSIERFKSTNYLTWNMKVEMFLKRINISSMVDGLNVLHLLNLEKNLLLVCQFI